MLTLKSLVDAATRKYSILATFEEFCTSSVMANAIVTEAARKIAERWAAEHYQEVAALIKPEAIATLVAAEVGADIGKTLKEDVRGRVTEVVKREVWQRGIFGGMTRVG